MLTELYIEALLADESKADQVWGLWNARGNYGYGGSVGVVVGYRGWRSGGTVEDVSARPCDEELVEMAIAISLAFAHSSLVHQRTSIESRTPFPICPHR
jgi:hypothetical protein